MLSAQKEHWKAEVALLEGGSGIVCDRNPAAAKTHYLLDEVFAVPYVVGRMLTVWRLHKSAGM
jgi:hypothetical protein